MKQEAFENIVNERLKKITQTLIEKGREYASSVDCFHNFKTAAEILGNTPEEALLGMLAKHLVSVLDIVKGEKSFDRQILDEKIGDTINYFVLLEGILIEKLEGEEKNA